MSHPTTMSKVEPSSPWRYSAPAVVLHWILAALIVFMAALGWYMMTIEHTPAGDQALVLHKSTGLIVFVLVVLRVLLRIARRAEPLPPGVSRWQVELSRWTQALLYFLMLAIPLTGIFGSEYSRAGLVFFGMRLPEWVTPDRATAHQLFEIHSTLVWVLVAGFALHVLGALKHLLVDHDEVFQRMVLKRR